MTAKLREGRIVMRAMFFRLVLVGAMIIAPLAYSQLLTHRDLSYSMAKAIGETAIDSCAAKGYAVSAVVVDRAGDVIVAMRADNAGPHTMENARRKAYTARSFRISMTAYAKRFADNDPVVRQQVTLPNRLPGMTSREGVPPRGHREINWDGAPPSNANALAATTSAPFIPLVSLLYQKVLGQPAQ